MLLQASESTYKRGVIQPGQREKTACDSMSFLQGSDAPGGSRLCLNWMGCRSRNG